jgi:hypothetical protein
MPPGLRGAVNQQLTWAAICGVAAEGFPVAVTIWATDNPLQNSGRDCQPPVEGLRFAVLFPKPQWCTEAFALGWLLLAIRNPPIAAALRIG